MKFLTVHRHEQVEGRGLQTETRRFPIHANTQYKRLHRQVAKGFGIREGFDLAYPKNPGQENATWIHMTDDHDISYLLSEQLLEVKVVASNHVSMNAVKRLWTRFIRFIKENTNDAETLMNFAQQHLQRIGMLLITFIIIFITTAKLSQRSPFSPLLTNKTHVYTAAESFSIRHHFFCVKYTFFVDTIE